MILLVHVHLTYCNIIFKNKLLPVGPVDWLPIIGLGDPVEDPIELVIL